MRALPHHFLQDFFIQSCIFRQPDIQQKSENLYFIMNLRIIVIGISGIRCFFESVQSIYWFNPFLLIMLKEADKDIENLCDTAVINRVNKKDHRLYRQLLLRTVAMEKSGFRM